MGTDSRQIVDVNGTPIKTSALREPQTAQVRYLQNSYIESHLDGLTPERAARHLRAADQGDLRAQAELFDDMLDRDAHLRCEYDKRALAPGNLDWSIEPPANASRAEKRAAEGVEALLRDTVDDLEDVLLHMMDAPGYGYAAIELEWERWGGDWIPNFHPRPQTWLSTDRARRELRLADGTADGIALQPMGWIVHQHKKAKTGYLGRAGLLRTCLWPFMYKAYSIGDFAELLETYGLPIIVGRYMSGAHPEEKASLMRAVTKLGHDARAIMPEDMRMEIQSITGGSTSSLHLTMVEWADRAQSKCILGQTLSSEAQPTGLGSGVASLHGEVRRDILLSDARQLAGTLTRDLVYPLVALNFGGVDSYRRCPRWVFDDGEAEDISAYATALPALVGVGMRIPRAWAHDRLRIPEPDDDDILAVPRPEMAVPPALRETASGPGAQGDPAATAATAGQRWQRAHLAALAGPLAAPEPDAADLLLDPLADMADAEVQKWVRQLRALLDAPGMTLARYQQALLDSFGDLPAERLAGHMAQALALAQLAGIADVREDG